MFASAQGKTHRQLLDEVKDLDEADIERVLSYVQTLKARPTWQKWAEDLSPTAASWDSTVVRFGRIDQGDSVEHVYMVHNVGDAPLKITQVTANCPCVILSWTNKYIQVGEYGYVVANFKPGERVGPQHFTLTAIMNTQPVETILEWKGEVLLSLDN